MLEQHMGEQEAQPQSEPNPLNPGPVQPPQPEPSANGPAATAAPELTVAAAPHPPPPPAKITPSRPKKIRKVSPEAADSQPPPPVIASVSGDDARKNLSAAPVPVETPKQRKNNKTPPSSSSSLSASLARSSPVIAKPVRVVARALSSEGEVESAIRHLRSADPLLAALIGLHPPPSFDSFHTPFLALTRSILYQQLAFKAGASIYARFISLCGGEAGVVPEVVLSLTPQQLRQIGVSGRKASYLHDLARKYQNGILSDAAIVNMDDKSLFTMLTMVNGIGSWSVHMFMIFSLHRPDVLPINDLGVRKGVQLLYNLEELPRPSQMDQLCEKWKPYRSVAAWYLWRFVEAKGSPSSAVAVATGAGMMQTGQQHVVEASTEHQQHQQQLQQQHQQQLQHHHQQQGQAQLLDPINSILNLGYEF